MPIRFPIRARRSEGENKHNLNFITSSIYFPLSKDDGTEATSRQPLNVTYKNEATSSPPLSEVDGTEATSRPPLNVTYETEATSRAPLNETYETEAISHPRSKHLQKANESTELSSPILKDEPSDSNNVKTSLESELDPAPELEVVIIDDSTDNACTVAPYKHKPALRAMDEINSKENDETETSSLNSNSAMSLMTFSSVTFIICGALLAF